MYYRHVSLENTVQNDLALQMITAINNKKATLNFDIRKVINILKCKLVYHSTANNLYCHSSSKPQSG